MKWVSEWGLQNEEKENHSTMILGMMAILLTVSAIND
jgi:hypothetical protein